MANRSFVSALSIAATAALAGCPGASGEKDVDAKLADAKAPNKKSGDAKAVDPKGTKAGANKPVDAKAVDVQPKDAQPKDAAADTNPFRKGQHARVGMTAEEIKQYAEAQGDPLKGVFTLQQALAGDKTLAKKSNGKLTAVFDTTMGKFECELYESKAPVTVANFVGLARGIRPSQDPKGDTWEKKKFYDGIVFHRVIKDFMLQTGDPTGSGTGGPGYVIPDEFGKGLAHRGKGIMSMANRGKNTGSSQFFITVADTPHLDGKHPVFGQCEPEIPVKISEVKVDPRRNNRPYEPVKINTIEITRKK